MDKAGKELSISTRGFYKEIKELYDEAFEKTDNFGEEKIIKYRKMFQDQLQSKFSFTYHNIKIPFKELPVIT